MIALIFRVALVAMFVVSGVSKFLDREGTRQAVAGFGLPTGLVPVIALALAPVEMVVAAFIAFDRLAVAGLVLSLLLLLTFSAAVAVSMRAGRRPTCRCFGRIGSAEISSRTLARNLLLMVLAGVALGGPATGPVSARAVIAGFGLAAAIIGAEAVAGSRARRRSDMREQRAFADGLATDGRGRAPTFRLPALTGADVTLTALLGSRLPLMLVYLSPGCGPCARLRPAVQRWNRLYAGSVTIAVIADGTLESNRAVYGDGDLHVLLDTGDTRAALGLTAPASAVLIDAQGSFASPVAAGPRVVRQLLASVLEGSVQAPTFTTTADMPAGTLDLDSVVRPRTAVSVDSDNDETLLTDETTGEVFTLDPIAALVWSVLDGRARLREIVADLADVFNTREEIVGEEVLDLVITLGRAGLLRGVAAEQQSGMPLPAGRASG